jgi:hypothetical protein
LHSAGFQDDVVEALQKSGLGRRIHIEAVGDTVPLDILDEPAFDLRGIVAVVEDAGAGQKIEIPPAVCIGQPGALGFVESSVEVPAVAANLGFISVDSGIHGVSGSVKY